MLRLGMHRRHPRFAFAAALVVAALAGQATLLHVHQGFRRGQTVREAPRGEGAVVLAGSRATDDTHHDGATCPACRALAQGRPLAVGARALALACALEFTPLPFERAAGTVASELAGPSSPRAPPPLA